MANDFSGLMIPILARAVLALRKRSVATRYINTSYSDEAEKKGATIQIPLYGSATVVDITPSSTPYDAPDTTVASVPLVLNRWKGVPLHITSKELWEIENGVPSQLIENAVASLADVIHKSILDEAYVSSYGAVGTPGTTPFATFATANDAYTKLTSQLAPQTPRVAFVDPVAAGALRALPQFQQAYYNPLVAQTLATGTLGNVLNVNWREVDYVPSHTSGTASGYLVNGASVTAGTSTIPVDTGTGTFVKGDIITFAGHTQQYVLTASVASVASSITISPALRANVADNAAITLVASHAVNLLMHRDAIGFASRVEQKSLIPGTMMESISDNDPEHGTGLTFTLEGSRQTKRDMFMLSCMWGVVTPQPQRMVRIYG